MLSRRGIRRRDFIKCAAACAAGGSVGLYRSLAMAAAAHGGHPLAPKPSHYPAKAKNLLIIYLSGGFSHVDTFDPKPQLDVVHGKMAYTVSKQPGVPQLPMLRSQYTFAKCGQSGLDISDLFPQLRSVADELCVIRSLHGDSPEHFQATMGMHTGSASVPLPSLGAWISYGLGTINPSLPSFIVLAKDFPYAGSQVWDSNFLPPVHQGVHILPGDNPIPNLASPARSVKLRELELIMRHDADELHARNRPGDLNLRASMSTFETALGMMRVVPELFDLSTEPQAMRSQYGVEPGDRTSFAYQCLLARRLLERDVRTIEIIHTGSSRNWDSHGDMRDHRVKAVQVDKALSALIGDLKQRGLLEQTLIAICTEFGRTPWIDSPGNPNGRSHFNRAFTSLLVGAGVKGGTTVGETDEYGIDIVDNPVHVHDYHATILHLMGIDHTRLTYRYAGRDFRLTDVHGRVVKEALT